MKTKVRVEAQVEEFVKSLAPDPRRRLRQAIKGLASGRGDIKRLARQSRRLQPARHRRLPCPVQRAKRARNAHH